MFKQQTTLSTQEQPGDKRSSRLFSIASKLARSKIAFLLVFVPCLFIFPRIVSFLDAKWFASGESPKGYFYIASTTELSKQPFELVELRDLSASAAYPTCPPPNVPVHINELETIECNTLEQTGRSAVIETIKSDDDYTITSRYRIEGHQITPLMSRVFGTGHCLTGLVLALLFCSILFVILRWITRSKCICSQANI